MNAGVSSFLLWSRKVVQPQANPHPGNAMALDDFSPDGMQECCYPKGFTVSSDAYMRSVPSAYAKGRHLCTHYEIWFFGPAFGFGQRVAAGGPTEAKIWHGLRKTYDYHYRRNSNENDPAHFSV